jgi:hypothetical protein
MIVAPAFHCAHKARRSSSDQRPISKPLNHNKYNIVAFSG